MEEGKNGITINIYGGSNQILPNATKAEQHFYGDRFAKEALRKDAVTEPTLNDDERRLLMFVEKEKSLHNYVANLAVCNTAAEVGEVVALMCENEPGLTAERIVKKEFIEKIIPFINGVESGRGIDNLRIHINTAWSNRKRSLKNVQA